MSEKRKNDTIIEGEYYDPDLPAQENTPPQKHRRQCTQVESGVGIDHHQE